MWGVGFRDICVTCRYIQSPFFTNTCTTMLFGVLVSPNIHPCSFMRCRYFARPKNFRALEDLNNCRNTRHTKNLRRSSPNGEKGAVRKALHASGHKVCGGKVHLQFPTHMHTHMHTFHASHYSSSILLCIVLAPKIRRGPQEGASKNCQAHSQHWVVCTLNKRL